MTGFFRPAGGLAPDAREQLAKMTACLAHRGPDASGDWLDPEAGVALGHRRLSILDLSAAGSQPMASHSGRYLLVTNGEIYNHLEIRAALAESGGETAWRGHSDTESLLAAVDRWGAEAALKKTVGMFALALWDRQEQVLTLARDRLGEKPLYYGVQGDVLLFGSELKSLRAHPAFRAEVDRDQLAIYLRRGYVPAPSSIYGGIRKLPPGCLVQFGRNPAPGRLPAPQPFWSLAESAAKGLQNPFIGNDAEAIDRLEEVLSRAVASQSVADVPLGAFLSGGIDSSTVVALMQAQSSRPVRTFAIGFHETAFNEAPYARAVAAHLGTEHTEMIVTPQDAMNIIPRLPRLYDEPFGDSSAIPTFLVAELARRHVTVSLSGDGGDELFGGYTRYGRGDRLWRVLRRVPRPLRAALAPACGRYFKRFVPARSARELYDSVMLDPAARGIVRGTEGEPPGASIGLNSERAGSDFYQAMMLADGTTYLPDDILVKVDRASMGVSLESRVPMLDHRVVEFAWQLPLQFKLRDGEGKWLLRQLLHKYVPAGLHDRPKTGFGIPVGEWIRGGMRGWAESLLAEQRLQQAGFLDARRVRKHWSQHLEGTTRSGEGIWRVLMFQAWLAETSGA
ncbi:MAG: asparagine synthase (glutamine-hydrolyzing) [Steroidobacteraceae bacterium]